jgi:hypothetical protein
MPVSILAPMSGDTVTSPVTISTSYTESTNCNITSDIGGYGNGSQSVTVPPSDGDLDSGSITVMVPSDTEFTVNAVSDAPDDPGDSQSPVTVTANGGPAPIGGITISIPEMGGGAGAGKKKYKVDGEVAAGSTAVYVVCQAIEIVVGPPTTRTVIAATSGNINPANNKWQVMLEFTQNAGASYVARAFAYDMNQTLLGSSTKPIK